MTVSTYKDGMLITLTKAFDSRLKILDVFYFAAYFFSGGAFLMLFLSQNSTLFSSLVALFRAVGFFLAAYRFANRSARSEKIFIDKNKMPLIKQGLLRSRVRDFDLSKISDFRFVDKPELTRHPLAGDSFDYLGFQTQQEVINQMYGDNCLAFNYEGKTVTFCDDAYS
jgi:hypothetical protein